MNKIVIILFICLVSCQDKPTSKVLKSITIKTTISHPIDSINPTFNLASIESYSKEGKLTSKIDYYDNQKSKYKYNYEYNTSGLLIKSTAQEKQGKETFITHILEYNSSDSLIYSNVTENQFSLIDSFIRGSSNKLLLQKSFIKKDTLFQFKTFFYDSEGLLILEKRYNKDSLLWDSTSFKYDKSNNLIEETVLKKDVFYETSYTNYHEPSKLSIKSKLHWINDSNYTQFDREFYSNNKLKEINKVSYNGTKQHSLHQQFDEKGNILKHKTINKDGAIKIWVNKYIYDTYGNWTLKKSYTQGELNLITRRILIYYDSNTQ